MSELTGNTEVKMGSERSFGIVFAIVFLLIALFPLLGDGGVRLWSGILFFVTVTPTGLFMRARGKDLLRQKLDPDAETYWIEVDPEQAALTSMKKQF